MEFFVHDYVDAFIIVSILIIIIIIFITPKCLNGSPGLSSVMCTYPLDMIRSRLAFQVKGEVVYTGILHTIQSIVLLEGGARGLYQGIVPTVLGMAPYAGITQ